MAKVPIRTIRHLLLIVLLVGALALTLPWPQLATDTSVTDVVASDVTGTSMAWHYNTPASPGAQATVASAWSFFELGKGPNAQGPWYTSAIATNGKRPIVLTYELVNEINGPSSGKKGIDGDPIGLSNSSQACNNSNLPLAWENNVAFDFAAMQNVFCAQIHAHEDWFMHRSDGTRLWVVLQGSVFYYMNPKSSGWRDYVERYLSHELHCDAGTVAPCYAGGVFLDNVNITTAPFLTSLAQYSSSSDDGTLAEFNTQDDLSDLCPTDPVDSPTRGEWRCALRWELHAIVAGPHAAGQLVLGNMSGYDRGTDWLLFMKNAGFGGLDGGMNEGFSNWQSDQYTDEMTWNRYLTEGDAVMRRGDYWQLVMQTDSHEQQTCQPVDGDAQNLNNCVGQRQSFGLASFLLVTDGVHGIYDWHVNDPDGQAQQFSDWNGLALGAPLHRYTWSDRNSHAYSSLGDGVYRREFQCGVVQVNARSHVGTITQTACKRPAGLAKPAPAPTVKPLGACLTAPADLSVAQVAWGSANVRYVDVSTDPAFGAFWNRRVSGFSTEVPAGYTTYQGESESLRVRPGVTYYVRTWDGRAHSPSTAFSIPLCGAGTPAEGS